VNLLKLAQVFALLSLVSIGGINAMLPEIRRQVVDVNGWMSDTTFAHLFAVSSAAPGPNVLIVSLIGWHLAGIAGLAVATVAIVAPSSLLAFAVTRALRRWSGSQWLDIAKASLTPLALGLILASGISMMRIASHSALTIAISLGSTAFLVFTRKNPLWAVAAASLVSVVAARLSLH
jgi:chromate transporter